MRLWGRKIFVVLVSVLTLGMYVPPAHALTDAADRKEVASEDRESTYLTPDDEGLPEADEAVELDSLLEDGSGSDEDYIQVLTKKAKEQTLTKMGPRINKKVDTDMTNDILPKIEEVVEMILADVDEDEVPYYKIVEELSPGYGEKIFNLYNHQTNEEVARFHVRRDKRPGDGYWFNFHYHLNADDFVEHHSIGEVYWEKNTPPKWMS
ncbi:YpjP family protein [Halobacillus amylolyticus]|uniref:YpjP family protein n=1 Tax=Halobacillus amylolyticus TaxID=2932259 RepID=A0ABY4HI81_9BACI|nr:YpjP family protein [Halobacillus amylolyticus]UOR13590.1 YpjP family protein [Halobacillus amylolyticus]